MKKEIRYINGEELIILRSINSNEKSLKSYIITLIQEIKSKKSNYN